MDRASLLAAGAASAYLLPAGIAYTPLSRLVGVYRHVSSAATIALTFDDGPQREATERFLELLNRLEVRATFFLVGEHVERFPSLVQEITRAGHELGNHGYRHRNHLFRNPMAINEDLQRGAAALEAATGQRPHLFRPPQGMMTGATRLAASRLSEQVVLWSCWGRDWRPQATPDSVVRDVLGRAEAGGIILLHDADYYSGRDWRATYAALPRIVEALRRRGLHVDTVGSASNLA